MRGSFPIEVGWCDHLGHGRAYLIRPTADWVEWSPQSERVHGISRRELERSGEPVEVVARRAFAAMWAVGTEIYSDNPAMDGMWLQKLLDAGGKPSVQPILDVRKLFVRECQALLALNHEEPDTAAWHREDRRLKDRMDFVIGTVEERYEGHPAHRAQPDAERLWKMWQDVRIFINKETS